MCNQFTLHHEFRIDTRRTKFEQKTDGIVHVCGSNEQGTQRSGPGMHRVLLGTSRKRGRNSKTLCIGSTSKLAQKKGLKFYQTRSNAIILHDTLPAYCIPKAIMMGTGEITYEEVYASPRPPPKISFQGYWMKKLGSEVCWRWVKTPNKPNQRPKIQLLEQGDLFWQSNHPVRVLRKSKNVSYLAAKAPMKEQGDLFSSCVPVSVERLHQDKDADENADADHVRTERPFESEQSIGFVHTH